MQRPSYLGPLGWVKVHLTFLIPPVSNTWSGEINFQPAPKGGLDGNTLTARDPQFIPLLGIPPYPVYPSAHSCYTSAQAEVFVEILGTQRLVLELTSMSPNVIQQTRYYEYAHDLVQEIIDAGVWGGIHYRESDVKSAALGRKVDHWGLKRYFLAVP
jgi:hypothetical protein